MSQVSAVIKEMIRQQLLTLHTCLVCKVLEIYSDGTAKVQPCTMMQTAKGTVKQHVALDGVPILDQIRSTVSVGKACVVVFAERDISAVRYAEFALPSASRHHSLSDGIIIGTIDGSGTVIPGESSVPLPSETATAKTSTNKKANGTEIQVDVKVSRQSGNKLQAKSDGLFVPESPDTNTTYNISKDGSTLKLTGSDGSESSVAIPENTNTTYRVSSGIFSSSHGVTLRGSDGSNSIAPLETYRRSLYLPDATAKNMNRVTERGYLFSTHGYAFKLTMSRYDSSHNFEMDGTYVKDGVEYDFIIRGDISVKQDATTISNLSIECNDPDNQLSVYAYNIFEPATETHDYVYYYAWIALYSNKDLSDWSCRVLTSIHYTDGEYIELSTPTDSDHSVNYVKMEEQVVKTADENTKYELSKTGSTITLTGTDGTQYQVEDSDTVYVHPKFEEHNSGFYKVTINDEGHVTNVDNVTDGDIYDAGGVIQNSLSFDDYVGYMSIAFMSLFTSGTFGDYAYFYIDTRSTTGGTRPFQLRIGGHGSTGSLKLIDQVGSEYIIAPVEDYSTKKYATLRLPTKSGTFALTEDIPDVSGKQDKLTAGTNITISNNVISAKDTTYSNATTSKAGLMSAADKTNLNANTSARHTHSNKATLDKLTDAQLAKLDGMDLSKYLPLAGGVMSGNIDLVTNKVDLLVGAQAANQNAYTSAVAGGTVAAKETLGNGLPVRKSIVGSWLDQNSVWHNIISARHRNGYSDGANYGMYLRSLLTAKGDLIWNKQTSSNTWQGERVLLDSANYTNYALGKSATASAASKLATARKINTVAFDGTKDITIPRSSLYVHAADGKTGTAGYALVATLTVTSTYANMPTIIRYTNRNGLPTELMIRFANVNSKDPTVSTFSAACSAYDDTRYRKAYLNKSASGTWDLYITKSEAYDTVRIIDMQNALGVNVTFKDALITALPSTAISPIFLGTTGWISMTKSSLILGGGIKYRLDNNRITVSGAFSLKQAITASLTGSVLATCDTLDLSGLYSYELSCVAHATYDRLLRISAHDDNGTATITGYPVKASGETIPAYSTFYFTMTGYLDGLSF